MALVHHVRGAPGSARVVLRPALRPVAHSNLLLLLAALRAFSVSVRLRHGHARVVPAGVVVTPMTATAPAALVWAAIRDGRSNDDQHHLDREQAHRAAGGPAFMDAPHAG